MTYQCYEDITTQAGAWEAALRGVDAQAGKIRRFFEPAPDELVFTSCGSPYYLGLANATLWRQELGTCATVAPASEIMHFAETVLPRQGEPVLITASRSGETTETIEAVRRFTRKFPGRTILIGCKRDSTLESLADLAVVIPEGHDDVIPQTKSFGTMQLALQYMAALVSGDEELAAALRTLPAMLPDLLSRWEPEIKKIAEADWEAAVFLGGGPLYGVACEGALKLTEMSLTRSNSYHTLEVRHGPRSVIDGRTLVVGLGSVGGAAHERAVLQELREDAGSGLLALTPQEGWGLGEGELPLGTDLPEHALGQLYLPLLQLLAYYRAVAKDLNPDESRNLSAYVTLPESG